ncbi:hypothetical protein M9Y10_008928 [Tritrichomonas musculus]|uniref:Protein kinase domain-containing protein n=1 Tax=Tritrichomonas musculus TaxID=1915356 RepID=A0ABR2J1Z7_9EUKA
MSSLASSHSPRIILIQNFKQLETWSSQTAVHRKKFEFAITQIRHFVQSLIESYDSLNNKGDAISSDVISDFRDFFHLIRQNLISTWTGTTLENSSSYVLDQIFSIFESIISKIKKHIPETHFNLLLDTESAQWAEYDALDLKAIEASFSQCLISAKENTQFHYLLQDKLKSIQEKLGKYQTTSISRTFSPIPVNYQSWRVNLSDFTTLKEIGRGITAQVFLAKDNRPGIDPADVNVAIKIFDKHKLNGSRFQSFQREVAVLATMQHPALMQLVGATDRAPYCIITKWMPNGSLFTDLHLYHRLNATMRTIAAFDIARGMQFMHSRQIAHRDLKSLNVLLDKDLHIKVCDFGFSRHADDTSFMTSNIGTPHWMAPEIFKKGVPYTLKVDVYAYGIVLWEITTSQLPYLGMESHEIIRQVVANNLRPDITDGMPSELSDLMKRCWDADPDNRPTFDEIVKLFKTNRILMNGADKEIVAKYIEESATTGEALEEEIEKRMSKYKKGEITLIEAFKPLEKRNMPNTSVDTCWSAIEFAYDKFVHKSFNKNDSNSETPSNLAKLFLLFISSSKHSSVVSLLRHLPRNSVPVEIISRFVEDIPTGSTQIDLDITVAACKNNSADLCAVYANHPAHVSFCLDVASQTKIDPQLKEAVIDKCIASLRFEDKSLLAASIRCLLILGDFKRISMETIRKVFRSDDESLIALSLLAITSFALANCEIANDIIDIVIEKWPNEKAKSTMIALCKNEKAALKIIDFIEKSIYSNLIEIQIEPILLKILIQAAKHNSLKSNIKKIVCMCNFENLLNEFEPSISFLRDQLGL